MGLILADVGGTNVRFATAVGGAIDPARTRRYENDRYPGFSQALAAYLADVGVARIDGFSIAVAGPVTGTSAKLTNRDWVIDAAGLQAEYPGAFVKILNDLSALGYALDLLGKGDVRAVLSQGTHAEPEGQRLVVGLGTGLNISPVLRAAGRSICLRVEYGLASLPSRAEAHLRAYLGAEKAAGFRIVEHALSGPGLSRLHAQATGTAPMPGPAILQAAAAGDAPARASLDVFATMLGCVLQDLRLAYLPLGGVYLAGSVARGLVDSVGLDAFTKALLAPPVAAPDLRHVPVSLITQDGAALLGCLNYASP